MDDESLFGMPSRFHECSPNTPTFNLKTIPASDLHLLHHLALHVQPFTTFFIIKYADMIYELAAIHHLPVALTRLALLPYDPAVVSDGVAP
ncbi:hypothetical protein AVEN_205387-1 [Araneus ventricosus]|uniref:Uncharacterized protein n=1 Tax=Araneus ventricosus TaxID=182803 RepID=A0A4Y2HVP3_ARAVE|nr:hypothetical protein AVEN_205387-1 [Araneus ventricosus]